MLELVTGERLVAAAVVLGGYLALCAAVVLRRRRRRPSSVDEVEAPLLVAFASQTGTAERVAQQTLGWLRAGSVPARIASLGEIDAATLRSTRRMLVIVSTCGEGDPPDDAAVFVRRVMARRIALPDLSYGLLALGDSGYLRFCGFGRTLDGWLQRQGARPLFPAIEVDDGDADALRRWSEQVAGLGGSGSLPESAGPPFQEWRLVERSLLNPGSPGGPVFHLALEPAGAMPDWTAGDIAEVALRNPPDRVERALADLGLRGSDRLWTETGDRSQAELLSCSRLPEDEAGLRRLRATPPQALPLTLEPLPHREYSIASLPADGRLDLLLRQTVRDDGQLGMGSAWLTRDAPVGGNIALRIRANRAFHPPPDDRPLILIGNGTGMAGLRAQLKARAMVGHRRNWLLFGERAAAHDLHFESDLRAWRDAGMLERIDLAFSREQQERVYVQDVLRAAGDELRRWVRDGATILVCGSRMGMSEGVDAVLVETLGVGMLDELRVSGRYRRDVY